MRSYLSKRKIKSHQYPFFRCIIPKDLQGNFDGITDFRLSLGCVRNEDTQILCLKLKQITESVFVEIRSGMKNLSLDDIKGKTVDDVMCCTANNKHVQIQFYDTDEKSIHLDFGDFETRCDTNTDTILFDEDSRKRTRFR